MLHTDHGLLPIQRAVAIASPRGWRDGWASPADRHGIVTIELLDGPTIRVSTEAVVAAGEPVAVHPVAEVLAVGTHWYPARPTARIPSVS